MKTDIKFNLIQPQLNGNKSGSKEQKQKKKIKTIAEFLLVQSTADK